MNEEQKHKFKKLAEDLPYFAKNCLKVKTKNTSIEDFNLNKTQLYVHNFIEKAKSLGKRKIVIIKARQFGISTYTEARFFHKTMFNQATNSFIMADSTSSANNIFEMTKRFYDNLPKGMPKPRLKKSNEKAIVFDDIDSSFRIGTAGNENIGRSMTINNLHCCLSGDSKIILADGSSKLMNDIKIGDLVCTSNGNFSPVKNKWYTGKKDTYNLNIWGSNEPIYLTKEHKVLTINGYKRLEDLTIKDYIAQPKIRISEDIDSVYFHLDNIERHQGGGNKHITGINQELNFDFGYFIGYYLAEGHIKKDFSNLSLTSHQKESYFLKALEGIKGLYKNYSIVNRKDSYTKTITIYSKFLATFIDSIVGRVEKKNIPSWFFNTNKEFLNGVLRGYLDGDGSKTQIRRINAVCIREKITRQLQRIICSLGYGFSGILYKDNVFRYNVKNQNTYTLNINGDTWRRLLGEDVKIQHKATKYKIIDNQIYCKVKSISFRKNEDVFDIEVNNKDHNFQTTVGIVSNSEVAFWKNADEIVAGLFQTVPTNSEIILESTANGVGNYFHDICIAGLEQNSEFTTCFLPWFWNDEYSLSIDSEFKLSDEEKDIKSIYNLTNEQINWRRIKLNTDFKGREYLFKQEYPSNFNEAFISIQNALIPTEYIEKARKGHQIPSDVFPIIFGVDPARNGDRTVISIRQGRRIHKVLIYENMTETELAGELILLFHQWNPKKCFIDVAHGYGTIDILHEKGLSSIVEGIPFNSKPQNQAVYSNKRTEIFGKLRDWLLEDCQIPDNDVITTELGCIPDFKLNSNGQYVMLPKDDIKKLLNGKSTDIADSLALTFASDVAILEGQYNFNPIRVINKPRRL